MLGMRLVSAQYEYIFIPIGLANISKTLEIVTFLVLLPIFTW